MLSSLIGSYVEMAVCTMEVFLNVSHILDARLTASIDTLHAY